ncbi:MAG: peptidylprolyl isomerase [Bacteroidales bacterium]|nr:peptidylprolyl isomerase [Bacteroidales bacterium]
MATLQTIRNRAGVLIAVIIGLALLAFILNDLIYSNQLFNSSYKTDVAEVYGKAISIKEYEMLVEELTQNYLRNTQQESVPDEAISQQIRDQAWEQLITNYVLANNLPEIGFVVHPDELQDMIIGSNIDPQILQIPIFKNQQTGLFDPNLVKQFISNMDKDPTGNARKSWVAFEKELEHQKLLKKYYTAVKKGLYVTNVEANSYVEEASQQNNIQMLLKRYSDVSDSLISVTDKDLENFYNEHLYLFEQEESRDIEYIVFDVVPSPADMQALQQKMMEIKERFATTENTEEFVNQNSDVPYSEQYFSKGELPKQIDSIIFASQPGFIYGPYIENNQYYIAKLIAFKNMPDSVHARHILISPNEKRTKEQAKKLADSLKILLDKKADFATLAKQYSDDKGSAQEGGDLKWFKRGVMVKPFEKAAFEAKKGEFVVVESQFGYHIIETLEKSKEVKKAEVAFIQWKIEPSSATYQTVQNKAYQFAGLNNTPEKFEKAITTEGLNKRIASGLRPTDRTIAGFDHAREIIRWAYKAKKGEISQPFDFPDKFVIAHLTEVREKGYAPLEQVREQVKNSVIKEKKAEKFIQEFKANISLGTLQGISAKMNIPVMDASNINFASFSIPGVGIEPKVIAAAAILPVNKISNPIKGNNGVFIINVTERNKQSTIDVKQAQLQMTYDIQARVDYQAFEALKKLANIVDNRILFY